MKAFNNLSDLISGLSQACPIDHFTKAINALLWQAEVSFTNQFVQCAKLLE